MNDRYNIQRYWREVNRDLRAAYRHSSLQAGTLAPSFELGALDGARIASAELLAGGDVLLVFGCHSAPPCVKELPEIDRINVPEQVTVLFVYTREIHPNENLPYGRFAHHRSMSDKVAAARQFRDTLRLRMPVGVDDLAGSVHLAYGGLPFCAAVIRRDGILVHRSEWASAAQLAHVIDNLAQATDRRRAGGRPRMSFSESLWAMERLDGKP